MSTLTRLRSVCCQNFSTFPLDIKSLHFVYATSKITTKFCFLDSFYLLMSNCIFQIVCLLHQISSNSCLREIMQRERFTTEPETRSWNNFIGQIICCDKTNAETGLVQPSIIRNTFFPFLYRVFRVVYRNYETLFQRFFFLSQNKSFRQSFAIDTRKKRGAQVPVVLYILSQQKIFTLYLIIWKKYILIYRQVPVGRE